MPPQQAIKTQGIDKGTSIKLLVEGDLCLGTDEEVADLKEVCAVRISIYGSSSKYLSRTNLIISLLRIQAQMMPYRYLTFGI